MARLLVAGATRPVLRTRPGHPIRRHSRRRSPNGARFLSIPHVALVEVDLMPAQQRSQFVLKRYVAMVLLGYRISPPLGLFIWMSLASEIGVDLSATS